MQPFNKHTKAAAAPAFCKPPKLVGWLGCWGGLVKWQPFSRFSLCYGHSNNTELLSFTYGNEGPMHATKKRREEKRSERFPFLPSSAGSPWVTSPVVWCDVMMTTTCALIQPHGERVLTHATSAASYTVRLTNKRDSLNVPTRSLERLTPV